jgi:hypothetical protein
VADAMLLSQTQSTLVQLSQDGFNMGRGPGTDVMIFKNIFAEKFSEKIGVFCSNYC